MPRYARVVVRHYPHHIVHKGNGGQAVFLDKSDYNKYLELLEKYSKKWHCGIQAYCLMPNHVHILVIPPDETSLAKTMHSIAFLYTQYFESTARKVTSGETASTLALWTPTHTTGLPRSMLSRTLSGRGLFLRRRCIHIPVLGHMHEVSPIPC